MTIRVAINGYGRIGRNILRAHYEGNKKHDIQIVAINDLGNAETNAHLTQYDTAHGKFPGTVAVEGEYMVVNGDKIAVQGHSRYGKATLVTAAYDERVVVAWPSDAGALGTAMARRHWGESLEFVASASGEYHWVNGNILKYAGPLREGQFFPRKLELLDVDAHSTTALLAPRAVFVTNGTDTPPGFGDAWADPRGTFLSGQLASPVWNLLGWKGQIIPEGTAFTSGPGESIGGTPPFNVAFIDGTVGWRRQIEGHVSTPNWPSRAR